MKTINKKNCDVVSKCGNLLIDKTDGLYSYFDKDNHLFINNYTKKIASICPEQYLGGRDRWMLMLTGQLDQHGFLKYNEFIEFEKIVSETFYINCEPSRLDVIKFPIYPLKKYIQQVVTVKTQLVNCGSGGKGIRRPIDHLVPGGDLDCLCAEIVHTLRKLPTYEITFSIKKHLRDLGMNVKPDG